jgi:hypothetical protein
MAAERAVVVVFVGIRRLCALMRRIDWFMVRANLAVMVTTARCNTDAALMLMRMA